MYTVHRKRELAMRPSLVSEHKDVRTMCGLNPIEDIGREVSAVRPHPAEPFRGLVDEDLSWLGFWLGKRAAQD